MPRKDIEIQQMLDEIKRKLARIETPVYQEQKSVAPAGQKLDVLRYAEEQKARQPQGTAAKKLAQTKSELDAIDAKLNGDPLMPINQRMSMVNQRSYLKSKLPALKSAVWQETHP